MPHDDDDCKAPDGWSGPRVPVFTWTTEDEPSVTGATRVWIALLVATAIDNRVPEPERRRAARQLVDAAFVRPVHSSRWPSLDDRGVTPDDVRAAARDVLPPELWAEVFADADFHPVRDLDRVIAALGSRLGDVVPEALTGRPREPKTDDGRPRTVTVDDDEALEALWIRREARSGLPGALAELWERELLQAAGATDRERSAWRLYRRGVSYDDMADELGCATGTAKSLVHRVRQKLRDAV